MSAPGSEFEPVRGAIVRVQYVHFTFHSVAIVEEKLGQRLFVMWYDWDEEWILIRGYQMGYVSLYHDELPILNGPLIDVGLSIGGEVDVVLAVEGDEFSRWYIMFEVNQEGFWEVIGEVMLDSVTVGPDHARLSGDSH